ncbi:MAG: hypothetical protein NTV46_11910 [Verrucomicrobia bacterium]|nr:hypothetical protein [Verrucomicrobiota bacterium]
MTDPFTDLPPRASDSTSVAAAKKTNVFSWQSVPVSYCCIQRF